MTAAREADAALAAPHVRLGVIALGEHPAYVIGQLGDTDPALTLRLYAREMARRDGERERLRALVEGREWAPTGTSAAGAAVPERAPDAARNEKTPQ